MRQHNILIGLYGVCLLLVLLAVGLLVVVFSTAGTAALAGNSTANGTATATPTPTATITPTASSTATATPTPTATITPTATPGTSVVDDVANRVDGPTATPTPTGDRERIDNETVLLGARYDGDMAHLKLRSSELQHITVTDGAAMLQGGQMRQRQFRLKPGQTTTVSIRATEYRGIVALSVATDDVLWAVPVKGQATTSLSWVDRLTSGQALGWGAVSAFVWIVLMGIYVLYIEGGEPEVA